jgi:hypothetical protein
MTGVSLAKVTAMFGNITETTAGDRQLSARSFRERKTENAGAFDDVVA